MRKMVIGFLFLSILGACGTTYPEAAPTPVHRYYPLATTSTTAPGNKGSVQSSLEAWTGVNVPLTKGSAVPADVFSRVQAALTYGYKLGLKSTCLNIKVDMDDGTMYPGLTADAEAVTLFSSALHPECVVVYRMKTMDGTWKEDYVIRHEVSHLLTLGDGHGSIFRAAETQEYKAVGIQVFYFSGGTYPDCFKVDISKGVKWSNGASVWCTNMAFIDRVPK